MIKYIASIVLLMMSYSIFSQGLTPRKFVDRDTSIYGFTKKQGQFIAKKIIKANYCDSLMSVQDTVISGLEIIIDLKQQSIHALQEAMAVDKQMIKAGDEAIEALKKDLAFEKKKFRKKKFYWLGAGLLGGFVAGIILVH